LIRLLLVEDIKTILNLLFLIIKGGKPGIEVGDQMFEALVHVYEPVIKAFNLSLQVKDRLLDEQLQLRLLQRDFINHRLEVAFE